VKEGILPGREGDSGRGRERDWGGGGVVGWGGVFQSSLWRGHSKKRRDMERETLYKGQKVRIKKGPIERAGSLLSEKSPQERHMLAMRRTWLSYHTSFPRKKGKGKKCHA